MKRLLTIGLAASCALLAACGRTSASFDPGIIETYRTKAELRLKALDDLPRQLSSAMPLEQETAYLPLDGVRFGTDDRLQGRVNSSGTIEGPMPDGIILDISTLGPDARPDYDFDLGERPYFLEAIRGWLAGADGTAMPRDDDDAHQQFQRLLALQYVIVLRRAHLEWPEADGAHFKPGGFIGEALVFELDGERARFLGGLRYGGTNSDTVKVRYEQNREYQKREWLVGDLKYNVYTSLHDRLLARSPGIKLPPTDWYKPTL